MTEQPQMDRPATMVEFLAFYMHETRRSIIQAAFKDLKEESKIRRASKVHYQHLPEETKLLLQEEAAELVNHLLPYWVEAGTDVMNDLTTCITALNDILEATGEEPGDDIYDLARAALDKIGWDPNPQENIEGENEYPD